MNLALISKYRSELMGIAMLLVVWHHIPISINSTVYDFLKLNAGFGVDIFLLCSGMGLYFSMSKGLGLRNYYLKRFVRIFPIWTLFLLCLNFVRGNFDLTYLFLKITTIGWWMGNVGMDYWFIPNIVVLYILYPLFHQVLYKSSIIALSLIVLIYLAVLLLPEGNYFQQWYRYPTFFLGGYMGMLIKKYSVSVSKIYVLLFLILFVVGLCLSIYGYVTIELINERMDELKQTGWLFLPYFFITPGFCIIVVYILEKYSLKYMNMLFHFLGTISIEIYLLHGQFIELTSFITHTYDFNKIYIGGLLITLSFIMAYYTHKINNIIMGYLKFKLNL